MELDNFTSDIQALIAGKLTTSDLARIRVGHLECHTKVHIKVSARRANPDRFWVLQVLNKAWKEIADRTEVGFQYLKSVTVLEVIMLSHKWRH